MYEYVQVWKILPKMLVIRLLYLFLQFWIILVTIVLEICAFSYNSFHVLLTWILFFWFQVWLAISGVEELQKRYGADLYSKRLNCILDSDIVQAIRTDLPRTFPDNIYFVPLEGYQEQLYRILFAYAADNSNVGYCQVIFTYSIYLSVYSTHFYW